MRGRTRSSLAAAWVMEDLRVGCAMARGSGLAASTASPLATGHDRLPGRGEWK
jgi:hypothetical protein